MKKELLGILFGAILLFGLAGCDKQDLSVNDPNEDNVMETFDIRYKLSDGRIISFAFNVPYNSSYLHRTFENNEITIDEFINRLELISDVNDGGSKLYKYNNDDKIFGNEDFYTLVCNSYMNIKDIFVAKNIDSLTNKCVTNVDELNNVNNKIIDYFTTNGVKNYENFCSNYVDEITGVVVVELLDNSIEEQNKFKRLVVDSDLIEFRKGEKGTNDLK